MKQNCLLTFKKDDIQRTFLATKTDEDQVERIKQHIKKVSGGELLHQQWIATNPRDDVQGWINRIHYIIYQHKFQRFKIKVFI